MVWAVRPVALVPTEHFPERARCRWHVVPLLAAENAIERRAERAAAMCQATRRNEPRRDQLSSSGD